MTFRLASALSLSPSSPHPCVPGLPEVGFGFAGLSARAGPKPVGKASRARRGSAFPPAWRNAREC